MVYRKLSDHKTLDLWVHTFGFTIAVAGFFLSHLSNVQALDKVSQKSLVQCSRVRQSEPFNNW